MRPRAWATSRSCAGQTVSAARLLEQAVIVGPVTEADVTHGYSWLVDPKM